ncbi:MAG: hypothetical protein NVS4B2_34530 [Chloroflexota bacterium]
MITVLGVALMVNIGPLGWRLGEEAREWAERAAGLLLIAAGVLVLVEKRAGL